MADVVSVIGSALGILVLLVGAYLCIAEAIYVAKRSDATSNDMSPSASNTPCSNKKYKEMSGNISV